MDRRTLVGFGILLGMLTFFAFGDRFVRINQTHSLPVGIYRVASVTPSELRPGQIVVACPLSPLVRAALQRNYLHRFYRATRTAAS